MTKIGKLKKKELIKSYKENTYNVNAEGNLIELTCILYTFCQPEGFYGNNHMPS